MVATIADENLQPCLPAQHWHGRSRHTRNRGRYRAAAKASQRVVHDQASRRLPSRDGAFTLVIKTTGSTLGFRKSYKHHVIETIFGAENGNTSYCL